VGLVICSPGGNSNAACPGAARKDNPTATPAAPKHMDRPVHRGFPMTLKKVLREFVDAARGDAPLIE